MSKVGGGGGNVSGGGKTSFGGGAGGVGGAKCTTTATKNDAAKTTTLTKSCGIEGFKGKQGIDASKFSADKLNKALDAKTDKLSIEVKPVKNDAALSNAKLSKQINQLNPKGPNQKFNKKGVEIEPGGVASAKKQAKVQAQKYFTPQLKADFEAVGKKYNIAPALLAGIASRESGFGSLLSKNGKLTGWGDPKEIKDKNGKVTGYDYRGFGIMQVDKNKGGTNYAKMLKSEYNKTKLNPYSKENIEAGAEIFNEKMKDVKAKYPNLSEADKIATAVSRYNGGIGKAYPNSDIGTTGKDYANDTLVRAGWFAGNWENIGN